MKKITLCILVMFGIPLLGSCAQAAPQTLKETVVDFSAALYENKDIGASHDLSRYIEGCPLATYLSGKVDIHQLVTERAGLKKTNYIVQPEPTSVEELTEDTYFVTVKIEVSFNYTGMEDITSGYGEVIHLVLAGVKEG